MKAGVVSSRALSHPLNPWHKMSPKLCLFIDMLDNPDADGQDLASAYVDYMKSTGAWSFPKTLGYSEARAHYIKHLTQSGTELDSINTMRFRAFGLTARATEVNHENFKKILRNFISWYDSYLETQVAALTEERERISKI